jgi:hypothetical protein
MNQREIGWRPIPLALKILFAVLLLWTAGSIMNMPNLMANGLPLLSTFIYGAPAAAVAVFLDIIGPMIFLLALWRRLAWGPAWAFFYISLFIVNGLVALITLRHQLGLGPLLIPSIVSVCFLIVIYWKRSYFKLA